jgi:sirohydrochlorin ferrochelatase
MTPRSTPAPPRQGAASEGKPKAEAGPKADRLAIVLIDHGSRREEANRQLEVLADAVRVREPDAIVRTAHLEIAEPLLPAAIDDCVREGARAIVIHPYFLGPGRHTSEDIPRLVDEARARHAGVTIHISRHLGIHEKLVDVVLERIRECDDQR